MHIGVLKKQNCKEFSSSIPFIFVYHRCLLAILIPHLSIFPLHFFTPYRFIYLFLSPRFITSPYFSFFPRFFRQSNDGDSMLVSNLTSPCNTGCGCPTTYDPVCGTNGVLYYSACFAGCLETGEINGVEKVYKVLFY